ncbi:MAG: hypothetical protein LAT82_01795 [Nanoarchaeota archaeon]|nr:hypothetical protein [Nanoarchaeota archaeon]
MYEKINIAKELKQIPQDKLVRFLSSQLKKNEPLLKEFIKKFDISIQHKFIQDYIVEAQKEMKKARKSIGNKEYMYNITFFNKMYLHPKISYLKTLIKQEEYLESLKIIIALINTMCIIIGQNGRNEELGGNTTADKYKNKLEELEKQLIFCYQNIKEEESPLLDRRTMFTLFQENYSNLLNSPIFNFIYIRKHAKLEWFYTELKEDDRVYFDKYITFNK